MIKYIQGISTKIEALKTPNVFNCIWFLMHQLDLVIKQIIENIIDLSSFIFIVTLMKVIN
uniref:Uncharacterized protein n=1 Tax=Physcomitrium patens TaxID=3218 RepID=A0A2K1IIE8_PHYPA|nr:hypothetical protein PHYPA_027740 [Physcomitrium patens]